MALSDILAQIVAVIEGVSDAENVYDYDRFTNHWNAFKTRFQDSSNRIHGWTVSRTKTPAVRSAMPIVMRHHTFTIRGVMGLKDEDATEKTFQNLVEDLQDAFEDQYRLGGYAENSGPLQVEVVENRMFCNKVLCHYARLTYEVKERKTYS